MYALRPTLGPILNQLYLNAVVKESCRYARTASKKLSKRPDPGIRLQKSLLSDDELEQFDDLEGVEADFTSAGLSHKEHMKEIEAMKEREKHLIVRQKYFKQKSPNFLTWNDVEQIRYLHRSNPEEWSIEKLSESFPALPTTIAKICKGNWVKKNEAKIKNHDKSVQNNWKLFKENKLPELPQDLVEHLNRFTQRIPNLQYQEVTLAEKKTSFTVNRNTQGEYSEIIASYERLKSKNKENKESVNDSKETSKKSKMRIPIKKLSKKETYLLDSSGNDKDNKFVTLEKLHSTLEESLASGEDVKESDLIILQELRKGSENQPIEKTNTNSELEIVEKKYASNISKAVTVQDTKYRFLTYPEKIVIPKNKLKRGCLYKLNDCYYDDDGEFLYRVPGME